MKKLYMRLRKKSFLVQILLSIFGIICIPLLVIQFISISRASWELEAKNKEFYNERITANANLFESQISSLTSVAAQIYLDESISKLISTSTSHYDRFVAAETIKKYSDSLPYVEYTGAYYPKEDFLLKEGYAYSLKNYCDIVANGDPDISDDLCTFFRDIRSISLFSTAEYADAGNTLIFARPFASPGSAICDTVIFFSLDISELGDTFTATFPDDVNFVISAPTGQILMNRSNDAASKYNPVDLLPLLNGQDSSISSNGTICRYTSPTQGYTYLAIISNTSIQDGLSSYVRSSRNILFLSAVISLILLAPTVYIIYNPLKQLLSRHISIKPTDFLSELELLDSELFSQDQEIANQSTLLSNFILDDLLFGHSVDPTILARHFPADKCKSFIVSIANCLPMNTIVTKSVSETLEEQLSLRVFITSTEQRLQTILVFISNQPINTTGLKEHILLAMEQCKHHITSVSIGKPVDAAADIRISYHEAQLANSPASLLEGGDGILYPSVLVQELVFAISNGLAPRASEILDDLQTLFTSPSLSVGVRNAFCYRLLDTIIPKIQNASAFQKADIERLLNFYSVVQMFTQLREIITRCCLDAEKSIAVKTTETRSRLIEYVDQNFRDPELCLTSVANCMNLSIYTVSRLFKESTKQGFKEYVTEKRLEHASMLLKVTDMSIANIAGESGFSDSSYFAATFKRKYGVQPNFYREMHTEQ